MTQSSSAPGGDATRVAGAGQGVTIVAAGFLPVMAIVALAPAVPSLVTHFHTVRGAATLAPLMVTAPGLMIALAAPVMGWACDRFGRRVILIAATFLYGVLGLAPLALTGLAAIFASRIGLGVCEAAILTVTNALIGDYFDLSRRRNWLTWQGVFGPICGTVVIILSGLLTERVWNGAFAIYGVAFLIFGAMLAFIYEPERPTSAIAESGDGGLALTSPFPWPTVLLITATTLFAASLYYVYIVQIGLAFAAVGLSSPRTLGFVLALVSVGVPLGAILFGYMSLRVNRATLIATFLGFIGVGMIGVGLSRDYHLTAILAVLQQVGAGMTVPTLIFWATSVLRVEHRGRGMGLWASAFFLGQFVSPLIVGLTRSVVGGGILPTFAALGCVSLLGAILSSVLSKRTTGSAVN